MHNQQLYQAVVGSQLYLSTKTRPVIAYTVSCVARFCAKPSKEHWTGVKRILRYLKGTNKLRAHLQRRYSSCNHWILRCRLGWRCWRQKINLWVRVPSGRCCYELESSKQTCVALSSAEAEYVALATASQEAIWLQQLMGDLLNESIQETTILEDNQSAICLAKNQSIHGRTKHIDIKYHFIRDAVEAGKIKLVAILSFGRYDR